MSFDRNTMTGRLVTVPERAEIPVPVDERLIVEHYSRRV
jgi:ribosomal protein S4